LKVRDELGSWILSDILPALIPSDRFFCFIGVPSQPSPIDRISTELEYYNRTVVSKLFESRESALAVLDNLQPTSRYVFFDWGINYFMVAF